MTLSLVSTVETPVEQSAEIGVKFCKQCGCDHPLIVLGKMQDRAESLRHLADYLDHYTKYYSNKK